jgi:hypothetical protein
MDSFKGPPETAYSRLSVRISAGMVLAASVEKNHSTGIDKSQRNARRPRVSARASDRDAVTPYWFQDS